MPSTSVQQPAKRGERFLGSVLWSWFGVCVSIFSASLLTPITVHKLGAEGYGVWTVILTLVDYFWLMDLGFRSATLKYTAHYHATAEPDKINEVLNTAILYATGVFGVAMAATLLLARQVAQFEHISPAYQKAFTTLITVVGIGWASGAIFNLFTAAMEGFQRSILPAESGLSRLPFALLAWPPCSTPGMAWRRWEWSCSPVLSSHIY